MILTFYFECAQIVMEQFLRLLIDCGMDPNDVDFVSTTLCSWPMHLVNKRL
jgi:hypothetical protein